MQGISQDDYIVISHILEELEHVMGTMAIHEKNASTSFRFVLCLFIKVFDHPLHTQFPVSPPIWRVTKSKAIGINMYSMVAINLVSTHEALETLSCAHFVMKF